MELAAYRIIQEALTNALRHSRRGVAGVALGYEPGFVTVRVSDDGPDGPAPAAAPAAAAIRAARSAVQPSVGFGLAGIAERVAFCGGHLSVGPTDAGGFAVTARLPAL